MKPKFLNNDFCSYTRRPTRPMRSTFLLGEIECLVIPSVIDHKFKLALKGFLYCYVYLVLPYNVGKAALFQAIVAYTNFCELN